MTETDDKVPDYLGHRKRIRDKFLQNGGESMADYEMLELLLTMSIPRRDVKPVAKDLVRRFGSFAEVINASQEELMSCEGIKETSVALLKAVKESAIRMQMQNLRSSDVPVINNWDAMIDYCRSLMAYKNIEEFRIIYLNSKLRVIEDEIQQRGTIDQVSVHPREVIKSAIAKGASAIILVHNHPSGDTTPSRADIQITRQIVDGAKSVNIQLLDHLIISKNEIYSFKDHHIL